MLFAFVFRFKAHPIALAWVGSLLLQKYYGNGENNTSVDEPAGTLTPKGYATGVEIKVSKQDLRRDIRKVQWKDRHLKERHFGMFKHFYYAVPDELVEETEKQIPEWCGILKACYWQTFKWVNNVRIHYLKPIISVHRKPHTLFNRKWTEEEMRKTMHLGTMRVYGLKKSKL